MTALERVACIVAAFCATSRAQDLAAVKIVDDWLNGYGPPPPSWTVRAVEDVTSHWRALGKGYFKQVYAAEAAGASVVVKRRRHDFGGGAPGISGVLGLDLRGEALFHEREVRGEVLYASYLGGLPGVPRLRGAWLDRNGTRVTYVADRAGAQMGDGDGDAGSKSRPSKAYAGWARRDPLSCALALLRCFASFAGTGGFFLDDFAIKQFALDEGNASVSLVDGPKALRPGPIKDLFKKRGLPTLSTATPCGGKADPPCPYTQQHHACLRDRPPRAQQVLSARAVHKGKFLRCEPGSEGAPEARGLCAGAACEPLSEKTHVFDVAAKAWALPLIAARGRNGPRPDVARVLETLVERATRPDPADRPTFAEAIAFLEEGAVR